MCEDKLALRKLRADLLRESREPRLRAAIALVHSSEVLRKRTTGESDVSMRF